MTKLEFLDELKQKLSLIPQIDTKERLQFYEEIIDDKIEEGLSESEAVEETGSVEDVFLQIISDIPLSNLVKEKVKSKRKLNILAIILIILGIPVWLPILLSLLTEILALYAVMWVLILSLWAVFIALCAGAIGGAGLCALFILKGNTFTGIAMLSMGIICAGLSIFMFFGCKAVTKYAFILTKKIVLGIKKRLVKGGKKQ